MLQLGDKYTSTREHSSLCDWGEQRRQQRCGFKDDGYEPKSLMLQLGDKYTSTREHSSLCDWGEQRRQQRCGFKDDG
jgi:hypothetical protein